MLDNEIAIDINIFVWKKRKKFYYWNFLAFFFCEKFILRISID